MVTVIAAVWVPRTKMRTRRVSRRRSVAEVSLTLGWLSLVVRPSSPQPAFAGGKLTSDAWAVSAPAPLAAMAAIARARRGVKRDKDMWLPKLSGAGGRRTIAWEEDLT